MRALLPLLAVWVLMPAPLWAMQAPASSAKPVAAPQGQSPAAQGQPAAPRVQPPAPQGQPAAVQGQPAAPPGQPPPAQGPPPAGSAAAPQAGPPENYTYDPAGRRDPFLDLLSTGSEPRVVSTGRRGEGAAGLSVGEISVRGVMQSRGAFYAMVQGPDGKTYMMHPGDKLLDGTVKSVNAEGIVIVQEVNDPLSLVKQREISKRLRSLEAKE
jgi:Tfp pilus assembly protein PilP